MIRLGIVASQFHNEIMEEMVKEAQTRAKKLGVKVEQIIRVPGAFDIPLAVKRLLPMSSIDGVVTLGCVIKGETDHDVLVATIPAHMILKLSLQYNKPVTLGITGPNQNEEQAIARIPRAGEVVEACVTLIKTLR